MTRLFFFFFFQAEDGIRDYKVTGVQTCALPICRSAGGVRARRGSVDAALRVGGRQGAPPQDGARGGAQRAAERHRGEDRRLGERARVAHHARAAVRRRRGARDPADGDRVPARAAARSARAALRLRRSEEHTSELQSPCNLVCRLLLEKKKDGKREWQQW